MSVKCKDVGKMSFKGARKSISVLEMILLLEVSREGRVRLKTGFTG